MNTIKHFAALLLCLCLVFSLCACSPEGDEALILGSWEAKFDVSDELMSFVTGDDISMQEYFDFEGIAFTVRFTFLEDGSMEYGFVQESSQEDYERFVSVFKAGMTQLLDEAYASQYGSFDGFCEQMGTKPDLVLDNFLSDLSPDTLFATSHGRYKVEDGKILISNDAKAEPTGSTYWVYTELNDIALNISESYTSGSLNTNSAFPKTFTKVD